MSSEIDAIWGQIQEARREHMNPRIVHIRVSKFGIPGSIAIVPMSPDRAKHYPPAHPWPHEIVMHFEDWAAVRRTATRDVMDDARRPISLFGIPVEVDAA